MHKLVILVSQLDDEDRFDEMWPEFLHISERMPGLIREATCRIDSVLFGELKPILQHELFFESVMDIHKAMSSPEGNAAGSLLQRMTGGRMNLYIADHKEDDIQNIHRFRNDLDDGE